MLRALDIALQAQPPDVLLTVPTLVPSLRALSSRTLSDGARDGPARRVAARALGRALGGASSETDPALGRAVVDALVELASDPDPEAGAPAGLALAVAARAARPAASRLIADASVAATLAASASAVVRARGADVLAALARRPREDAARSAAADLASALAAELGCAADPLLGGGGTEAEGVPSAGAWDAERGQWIFPPSTGRVVARGVIDPLGASAALAQLVEHLGAGGEAVGEEETEGTEAKSAAAAGAAVFADRLLVPLARLAAEEAVPGADSALRSRATVAGLALLGAAEGTSPGEAAVSEAGAALLAKAAVGLVGDGDEGWASRGGGEVEAAIEAVDALAQRPGGARLALLWERPVEAPTSASTPLPRTLAGLVAGRALGAGAEGSGEAVRAGALHALSSILGADRLWREDPAAMSSGGDPEVRGGRPSCGELGVAEEAAARSVVAGTGTGTGGGPGTVQSDLLSLLGSSLEETRVAAHRLTAAVARRGWGPWALAPPTAKDPGALVARVTDADADRGVRLARWRHCSCLALSAAADAGAPAFAGSKAALRAAACAGEFGRPGAGGRGAGFGGAGSAGVATMRG